MKKTFRSAVRSDEGEKPVNNEKAWNYDSPPYDKRSSDYVNAGVRHGVGKTQPVGTKEHSSTPTIPQRSHCETV